MLKFHWIYFFCVIFYSVECINFKHMCGLKIKRSFYFYVFFLNRIINLFLFLHDITGNNNTQNCLCFIFSLHFVFQSFLCFFFHSFGNNNQYNACRNTIVSINKFIAIHMYYAQMLFISVCVIALFIPASTPICCYNTVCYIANS